ncbi:tRNA (5-methylaminomethyl-2-thiouridine)(34)-methyltransferase MnmD [Leptolyngbya sp. PCC 6406]|uniref:tRNA (5-methylaminomethyl-2-thiouridine)(34)-methyltransferase MnmD n=1 Tax=Leptolyngbya sp. PCC 6406 TaxID=1173264 RepID=UPI0002AC0FBB|nr:MnmC family methyltransferase [Leptolyngbya sp. PCC 6406]
MTDTTIDSTLSPEPTGDGSQTFYSTTFGEWFHSRGGAYEEARGTYVEATDLVARAQRHSAIAFGRPKAIGILDLCYGLGYNTAAALEALWAIDPSLPIRIVGLELDGQVPQAAIAQGLVSGWPLAVQTILEQLATVGQSSVHSPGLQADLHLGDARQTIQTLVQSGFQADVIFLDPFSPPRCPQLWTAEFLTLVARCLAPGGCLATYSCAAAVRSALQLAGLHIGPSAAVGRRWPGTLANWGDTPLPALSQQEVEHLQTRAAVPYRDPTLTDSAVIIQQRRQQEQATSPLQPTGAWRKRWLSGRKG